MSEFDKELSENGNFVEAFRKVFTMPMKMGVPNEVLPDSCQIQLQKSSSVKATITSPSIYLDLYVGSLELFTALSLCDATNYP